MFTLRSAYQQNKRYNSQQQSANGGAQAVSQRTAEKQRESACSQHVPQQTCVKAIELSCRFCLLHPFQRLLRLWFFCADAAAEIAVTFDRVKVRRLTPDAAQARDGRAVVPKNADDQSVGDGVGC